MDGPGIAVQARVDAQFIDEEGGTPADSTRCCLLQ
jgi:hypothetical protein